MTTPAATTPGREILGRALTEIRELRVALESAVPPSDEPVAIIGMACRMPGAADVAAFWDLLRDGRDATTEVPADRFDTREYYDCDPAAAGKAHTRRGAFLDGIDQFDAGFFGVSPREAAQMDPQQRLFLEVSWEALEHAGQAAGGLAGTRTGVFMGVTGFDYSQSVLQQLPVRSLDAYTLTGLASTFAPGRLAHWLGIQGPALSVDTACSSALVAVHLAMQSLRSGDCAMALAGGVNVLLSPEWFVILSKAGMLAPDGRCKTFDASADGYVRGEGCGVVVLKTLSAALADNDRILAVIRGSAVNQDGRSSGITVPNGSAQRAVLREALRRAGVAGHEIGYVEAHGTGTALGDPIEMHALCDVLGEGRDRGQPFAVGSVKTNIGHLESAAGVAGLIKTVLMLQHGEIPPLLHLTKVNPEIPLGELPVTLPTRLTPWPHGERPRLAGVSSFGASGTNAHLILEEPAERSRPQAAVERPEHVVCLSARSEDALAEITRRYAQHLAGVPDAEVADVGFTANAGRRHFACRLAVRARSTTQLRENLLALADGQAPPGTHASAGAAKARPRVAFLFTGQGSQYPGMGRELFDTHPGFRRDLERCDAVLRGFLDRPLLEVMFNGSPALIGQTRYTQPALFALEYALARLWIGWGVQPTAMLGHSVGEYAAACVSGVFSLEDGLAVIAQRARLMQDLPAGGGMMALRTGAGRAGEALRDFPDTLSLAAVNGPHSVVVSGAQPALNDLASSLAKEGIKAAPLAVSHAFHSPLLDPMLESFEEVAASITYSAPRIPVVSNLTGRLAERSTYSARYLRDHARAPVRFAEGLEQLAQRGCRVFVEVGPAPVLSRMAKDTITDQAAWLPSLRPGNSEWETILDALGELYAHGAEIDWAGFDREYPRRRVELPTYPFQRKRHWFADGTRVADSEVRTTTARVPVAGAPEAGTVTASPHSPVPPAPPLPVPLQPVAVQPAPAQAVMTAPPAPPVQAPAVLGRRLASPLGSVQYESLLTTAAHPALGENVLAGTPIVNAGFYLEAATGLAADLLGADCARIRGLLMPQALVMPDCGRQLTHLVAEETGAGSAAFRYYGLLDEAENSWTLFARGTVSGCSRPLHPSGTEQMAAITARCPGSLSGARFYADLWERQLYLGRSSRWLERIRRGPGEALAWLRPADPGETEPYRLHPGIVDSALQLVLACIPDHEQAPDTLIILAELEEYRLDPAAVREAIREGGRLVCHARLREDAVTSDRAARGGDLLTADITLMSESGWYLADLAGVHLRRTRRDFLLQAIRGARRAATAPEPAALQGGAAAADRGTDLAGLAGQSTKDRVSAARLRDQLTAKTAAVLGCRAEDVPADEPLGNLGLDSLMATELRDAVVREFGVEVPVATFMASPTLSQIEVALRPLLSVQEPGEPPDVPGSVDGSLVQAAPGVAAPATVIGRTGPGGMHIADIGSGPPVIFVHGGVFGGLDAWQMQTPLAQRWRLVIPSRLNYGTSAKSSREDFEQDARLIAELLGDELGEGGSHLVAQSYGTLGAMLAAAARPEAVRSLTLIESAASSVARGNPAVDEYESAMKALLETSGDAESTFRSFYSLIDPGARLPAPLPPALLAFAARLRGVRLPWEAGQLPVGMLRLAPFPKLVITGGQRPVFEAIGDALATLLDGERLIVPGGHGTQNAGPPFNRALEEFLLRGSPGSATGPAPTGTVPTGTAQAAGGAGS
jgi:acyl transferase domain-containing protein/pimeloyl-ACP methyl ester carboxylesterase